MSFVLLPAVDVADGVAVRLVQGAAGTETSYGDPREAEAAVARLQAVSAADVQRVMRRHVLGRPLVAVHYSAAPAKKVAS